jgi:dTDP-4-amino-4,6-dideoxygalactose transaminase
MSVIPFVDLKAQYNSIKDEIAAAIQRVLDNTSFIMGKEVQIFEEQFAEYVGAKHCVALNSGGSTCRTSERNNLRR